MYHLQLDKVVQLTDSITEDRKHALSLSTYIKIIYNHAIKFATILNDYQLALNKNYKAHMQLT